MDKETIQKDLRENIKNREIEIYSYQLNINNFEIILKTIPSEWPERLLDYKGLTSEQIVNNVHEDDMQTVSDLVFRDKMEITLKIEKLEQSKAIHVLNALKSQLE